MILFSVFAFFSCGKQETEVKKVSILTAQTVFGDVTVENEGIITNPVSGTEIKENSIIKTGKLSILDIKYKDTGVIRINENSILNVAKLMESGQADETVLQMNRGKVFVSVAKLLKESKFKVKTATTVAAVRGTSFRVSAEPGKSRIDVLAGRIKVNPVKGNKVIETVEQYVETNNAVEIEDAAIDEIIEEKKEIEVVKLEQEDIETIRKEVKLIRMDEAMAEETRQEMQQIGIEVKPAEEAEDEEQYKEELTVHMQKLENEKQAGKEKEKPEAGETDKKEKELMLKNKAEEKLRQEQLKKEQWKKEKERKEQLRKEKEHEEQLRLEQLAKEKAEKERLAKEAQEKKLKEEKQKEEERVKNIPNF